MPYFLIACLQRHVCTWYEIFKNGILIRVNLDEEASIRNVPLLKDKNHEKGNVLFLILIAVALFAALAFVVAQSTRSGSGGTADEKARLLASQILNYTVSVSTGMNRLLASGCRLNQINFEREPFDGSNPQYENSESPDGFKCHVFHPNGGAVPYQAPPEDAQNIPFGKSAEMKEYYYNLSNQVIGLGTDNLGDFNADSKDFMIIMPYATVEVCRALNKAIHQENGTPPELINTLNVVGFWGGDLEATGSQDIEDAGGLLKGQGTACVHASDVYGPPTAGPGYYFYSVILTR